MPSAYIQNPDIIRSNPHWRYGKCDINSDTGNIRYLFDENNFLNSVCIKQYYIPETEKYVYINDELFEWPVYKHGASSVKNEETTLYGVIIRKLDNNPEFSEYLSSIAVIFNVIDHYIDILNYKNPIKKYIYRVTNSIGNGHSLTENHLNFNPAVVQTNDGYFTDSKKEEIAYTFTQNEKIIDESENEIDLLGAFYLWIQNSQQYYERHYSKLQDVLSDIGGIWSIILVIAQGINFFIHNYITLLNTQTLTINILENNFVQKRKLLRKPTLFKIQNEETMFPPKKMRLTKRVSKLGRNNSIELNNFNNKEGNMITNVLEDNINNNIISKSSRAINTIHFSKTINSESKTLEDKKDDISETENNQGKKESEAPKEIVIPNKSINWFKYTFHFIICCKNKNKDIRYFEDLREKIISEECLFQNYLNVYNLLKKSINFNE